METPIESTDQDRRILNILTGSSRGMGQAIGIQLLQRGDAVLGMARSQSPELAAAAHRHHAWLEQWQCDLTDATPVAARLEQWLVDSDPSQWREVRLINNAGMIPAIAPLRELQSGDITAGLRVGLEAAILITCAFLHATSRWEPPRKVLNISSGLGRRPMASQVVYCAAKAGIDHFSRCLALEEERKENGAKVSALAPGVIATDMQKQLRNASGRDFPDRARFQSLLDDGILKTPNEVASKIIERLDSTSFGEQTISDLRD